MNEILINSAYASTPGLEDCNGYFSKYLKARDISRGIDKTRYYADKISISAGKNVKIDEIDKIIGAALGSDKYPIITHPSENKLGTLNAAIAYTQNPLSLDLVLEDLQNLCKETSIPFAVNIEMCPDTRIFKGRWSVNTLSHNPWD